jgi:APA family basic amino acid/polyamine antiporter
MVAFAVMSSGITSASSAALAFGKTYLQSVVKEFFSDSVAVPTTLVAALFIAGLAVVNFRGVSESVKANVVLTCIELSGLLIVIVIGLYAIAVGDGDPGRLTQVQPASGQPVLVAITSETALAFFAMVGFEDSVNMAEECREPVRIFPKAMLSGMVVAALIYVLVAIASSLLIPAEDLAGAGSSALLKVVQVGAPGFPLWVFSLIVFAVVNVAVLVLRKETVEHQHFRAPTIVPVLGAVSCAYLASPLSGRPWEDYRIAGYLLLAGLVLWLINRVVHGKTEFRAESLSE